MTIFDENRRPRRKLHMHSFIILNVCIVDTEPQWFKWDVKDSINICVHKTDTQINTSYNFFGWTPYLNHNGERRQNKLQSLWLNTFFQL